MKTGTEFQEGMWPGLVPSFSPDAPFLTKGHGHDNDITVTSGYDVAMEGSKGLRRPMAWQGVSVILGTSIADITPLYHLTLRSDSPY